MGDNENIQINIHLDIVDEIPPATTMLYTTTIVPKRVFIVPYRNRREHKFFFSKYMSFLLEDINDYEIYFSHQHDTRNFNRGATKNIGFIAMKEKYPNDYKNITFIFNDVDTMPFNKIFDYQTEAGVVKHYYGFKTALGGIVVIKGSDFEKINGYPTYWGWGMEDKCLQKRCERHGIEIDRSQFHPIGSPEMLQLFDGVARLINTKDPVRTKHDDGLDGITTIHKLLYTIESESTNADDNKYALVSDKIKYINITTFSTAVRFDKEEYCEYDLRDPITNIYTPQAVKTTKADIVPGEWKNIPFRANTLPSSNPYNPPVAQSQLQHRQQQIQQHPQYRQQQQQQQQQPPLQYRQQVRSVTTPTTVAVGPTTNPIIPNSPTNIYAPDYARRMGIAPRASASGRVFMGGSRR